MGDFSSAIGYCENYFWDMEVEDNCFALLRTKRGGIAQLHASCTQWKNIFSMEVFCRSGQINIDGLGRSYGKETLAFYKMGPEMGPPDKKVYEWERPRRVSGGGNTKTSSMLSPPAEVRTGTCMTHMSRLN